MAKDFLPLITHLITSITTPHTGDAFKDQLGLTAFSMLGNDGTIDTQAVRRVMDEQQETLASFDPDLRELYKPSLNTAISCGESASCFCALFFGAGVRRSLSQACQDIDTLKLVVADNQPRLIRIDIGSHSYVIEQIAGDQPRGNVYQSNMAVYGYAEESGCTIQDFLLSYQNPVDLLAHLDMVKAVGTKLPLEERYELYKALYVTKGFIQRNDEKKIALGFKEAYAAGKLDGPDGHLQVKRLTWTGIDPRSEDRAYWNSRVILGYHLPLQASLNDIWAKMG